MNEAFGWHPCSDVTTSTLETLEQDVISKEHNYFDSEDM